MSCIKEKLFTFLFRIRFWEKLLMTANIWLRDWRVKPRRLSFLRASDVYLQEAESLYAQLDEMSREAVKKYLYLDSILPATYETACGFFYNYSRFFTPEERKESRRLDKIHRKLQKQYHFAGLNVGEESLLYHHGLQGMPEKILSYVRGKDFIDAGACYGDSSLVFTFYDPRKIYAFEPSPANARIFQEIMEKNKIPSSLYELVLKGLASDCGEICFQDQGDSGNDLQRKGDARVELVSLDSFAREKGACVGFLKADLEGMGLDMLKGAKETLCKDRPVLSIAIYHNREEFLGVYPFLKELLPDYHFCIRSHSVPVNGGELVLFGYPAELLP